ncbi:PVC-type heme-binding CxxCH protein [Dyadobacter sp. CY323]|uniref:PVC-type heme-binding CxxCH protein n=1 Tax=Dyadobacter sp. CY323 TaxID=2907302 RepID=UPI001F1BA34E|nr:PVC-type heme-binding CxxCH protein [Dyadobacter sp. CY323]MCE6992492.1 dehydrogenase [Dyadobacter sp. CY323]
MNLKYLKAASLLMLTLSAQPGISQRYTNSRSPEQEMATFQLHEGFGIEPFVVEPEVLSPIDMVFDGRGNIYVVEMGDYPYDAKPGNFKGRIRLLKDTNGDGKIDKSYVFAEGLPSATSILPWKNGIIVTAAPDILYLKDNNGDFKADTREVLFTGFFARNSEAQITSLRFGPDNWIYANNHGQAGMITSKQHPEKAAVNVAGGNFRFRADLGLFEVESGTGQFGQALDDAGHRFYTQNTLHIQQSPIAWRYAHRHDFMPSYRTDVNISDHELEMFQKSATPYWRQQRSDRRQAKYDSMKTGYKEYARDHFTGASGATFYGGDGFPKEFYGNIFTGEVAGNLVHRDVIKSVPGQAAFVATRADGEKDKEFLASTDGWFRPANFTSGPDGYLYLVDMYRQHIETPVSIPEDLKKDMDFANGEQYGRIWRIFPKSGEKRNVDIPNLEGKKSGELAALLSHPNQWWRLTAQRLLLEQQDKSVVPVLQKIFAESPDANARLLAFYALDGLNAFDPKMIKTALGDKNPGLREHALVLAEKYPDYLPEVIRLGGDANPQVAYQACLSLGQFSGKEAMAALLQTAEKNMEEPMFRFAILSSIPGSSGEFAEMMGSRNVFKNTSPGKLKFLEDFGYIAGARNGKSEMAKLLSVLENADKDLQAAGLNGLAKGIKRSPNKTAPDKNVTKTLQKWADNAPDNVKKAAESVRKALDI